jgi:hypothetical protein
MRLLPIAAMFATVSFVYSSSASAQATPLTRYFPDQPLAVVDAKDLQQAVRQTGSFGEETLRFMSSAFDELVKSELGTDLELPAPLRTAAVRTMVSSVRDVAVGVYSVANAPEVLAVVRLTPGNAVTTLFTRAFNDAIRTQPAARRLREGNYLATVEDGLAAGIGNNLFYLSTNADLLRAYLRRVNGQALPTLTTNTAYNSLLRDNGDGFFKTTFNLAGAARFLQRSGDLGPREASILRTLNLVGGTLRIVPDGMETRSVAQLNPSGGDDALYNLLTHTPQNLELLRDLPATAANASVLGVDTIGWLEYAQGFLGDLGLSASEQRRANEIVSQLSNRLGNEWAVVDGQSTETSALATIFGVSSVGGDAFPALLGGFLSPTNQTTFYARTQDGAQVLTDLETAFRAAIDDGEAAVERTTVGEFEALMIAAVPSETGETSAAQERLVIVNKNDTIVIGSNLERLEANLSAPAITENPLFQALRLPTGASGVQFVAPPRPTREQIEADTNALLESLGATENEIPQVLVNAYNDWYESYTSRTGVNSAYSIAEGNKLRLVGKNEFAWNR